MSKGIDFDPVAGRITIVNGERTVATTDGTLVNLVPAASAFVDTIDVEFPDFTKSWYYNHWWKSNSSAGSSSYAMHEQCASAITVIPQEWAEVTVLADAPLGADFFAARVRINRTAAPTQWGGQDVAVLVKENVWIPFFGSVLVEAELGMARAFSLYIDDDEESSTHRKLVLHRQQSVSVSPGGYVGSYGDDDPEGGMDSDGGRTEGTGLPIHTVAVKSRDYVDSPSFPFGPSKPNAYSRGGSSPCSLSDATDHASTYSVEIIGQFGRRS